MKKLTLGLVLLVAFAPAAVFADSIAVNGAAALAGSFGMELTRDNAAVAYVQDNTPADESIYRFEFLYDPNDWDTAGDNVRQTVFRGIGANPGFGSCPVGPTVVTVFDVYVYRIFGGAVNHMTAWVGGDFCGFAAVGTLIRIDNGAGGVDTNGNSAVRVCSEWAAGAANTGFMSFAVVDDVDSCASATYQTVNRTNLNMDIGLVRMGNGQSNGFGATETGSMYFDDFASFRTAAP